MSVHLLNFRGGVGRRYQVFCERRRHSSPTFLDWRLSTKQVTSPAMEAEASLQAQARSGTSSEWLELTADIDHAMADLQSVLFDILKALPAEALAAPAFRDTQTCRLERLKQAITGPPSEWPQANDVCCWDAALDALTNGFPGLPNSSTAQQPDQDVPSLCSPGATAGNEQPDQRADSHDDAAPSQSNSATGQQLDQQAGSHSAVAQSKSDIAPGHQPDQRACSHGQPDQPRSSIAIGQELDQQAGSHGDAGLSKRAIAPGQQHDQQAGSHAGQSKSDVASGQQLEQQAGSHGHADQPRSSIAIGQELDRQPGSHGHAGQSRSEVADGQQLEQQAGSHADQSKSDVASAQQRDGLQAVNPESAPSSPSPNGHKAGRAAAVNAGGGSNTHFPEVISATGKAQSLQLLCGAGSSDDTEDICPAS